MARKHTNVAVVVIFYTYDNLIFNKHVIITAAEKIRFCTSSSNTIIIRKQKQERLVSAAFVFNKKNLINASYDDKI